MLRTLTFKETVAGVTYTAKMSVPAGARLLDVLVETTTAWTAATAACDIGDSDANDALADSGTVDLVAAQGITASAGGGTDWGNGLVAADGPYSSGGPGKLYPGGDTITAVVTAGTPGGPTGISKVSLWIELPATARKATVV